MGYRSVLRSDLFEGQTIIVTGGGSGIGRCISHELASLGAQVVLLGRTLEKLETVAAEIEEDGGKADYWSCDIRDEERVVTVVSEIVERYDRIYGLVNNAGGQFPSNLEDISRNGFEAVVKNNLIGGFVMSREVFNQSMKHHGGAIVNITADCSNGFPGMAHTGAARAGVENITKTAAWEWGKYNVRVNSVAPGFIASSGFDSYDEKTQRTILKATENIPLGRFSLEAEMSAPVCFLLSPAASFITGDIVHVDGGGRFGSATTYWPQSKECINPAKVYDGFHRSTTPDVLKDSIHEKSI